MQLVSSVSLGTIASGCPRDSGRSCCSTDAKNALKSMKRERERARALRGLAVQRFSNKHFPVISTGCGKPSRWSSVGDTSARIPSRTLYWSASAAA